MYAGSLGRTVDRRGDGRARSASAVCWSVRAEDQHDLDRAFVTPIVVAPPLLSPFFSGRVHGARCW